MQQVLFRIPDPTGNFPDGIPIYAYGMMLFVTFLGCIGFATRYAYRSGVPKERLWDLAIWVFFWGILGGRTVYMIQYHVPWNKFFNLWEGGLVIYGALIGGFIAYWGFYLLFLKQIHVSSWRLADVAAPTICIGLALGRLGCLLNGCCYGGVAGAGCPALEFPLLTSPAREAVVEGGVGRDGYQYQTIVGFAANEKEPGDRDVRTVVTKIEPGSAAAQTPLKEGDRIVAVNGKVNGAVLSVVDAPNLVGAVAAAARQQGYAVEESIEKGAAVGSVKVFIPDPAGLEAFRAELHKLAPAARTHVSDTLGDLLNHWPRGRTQLHLTVERDGQEVPIPEFTPRTLGLHPTQLYETVSMILLLFLLLAYYPFRRHNGQLFVLFMIGYAIHRFLNEILRDDTPIEGFKMTLSQNISVLIIGGALVLELWLRWTQPKRTVRGIDEYATQTPPAPEPAKP